MSSRLPLQSKAFKPKFENKKAIFGNDDDEQDEIIDERVVAIEDNKLKEAEPKKKAELLVISPLANIDFRATAQRKKELYIPSTQKTQVVNKIEQDKPITYGLNVPNRQEQVEAIVVDQVETIKVEETTVEEAPKTLEERAIELIIKESRGELEDEENKGPKKVIPAVETLAFKDDYEQRPDETTLDDYERVPVEEFGAALLRGLGWNEGEGIGRNRKQAGPAVLREVKVRDALLGLGAKPSEVNTKDDREKSKNRREAFTYKDTSLFKKISKRKIEEDHYRSSSRRDRSRSPKSSRRDRSRSPKSSRRDRSRSPKSSRRDRSRSPKSSRRDRSRSPKSSRRDRSRSPKSSRRDRSRSPKSSRRDRSRSPKSSRRDRSRSPSSRSSKRDRSRDRSSRK